jgi:FtsP/CotA-like multicopper oxidase with cupredoxin domain
MSRRRVLSGALAAAGTAVSARAQASGQPQEPQILRARPSGFDGAQPGPTLRVRRSEEIWVRVVNELTEPAAVHWHGIRLINAMDGAPPLTQAPVAPGQSFDYRFVAPDAGTFWYHPAGAMPRSLYGAVIVSETEPIDVDGDVTLILAATGGTSVMANGVSDFLIETLINERLRLRFINACAGEILSLRIAGLRTHVMATDGQPAEPFAARDGRLSLGPGNRIDVFIDCTLRAGETVPISLADSTVPIARIVCKAGPNSRGAPRADPIPLPRNPLPERFDLAKATRFDVASGSAPAFGKRPLFSIKRGETAVLALSNSTSENSFIHLHGHSFRLLDALDDGWKPFWLDTLPLAPQSKARIAFVAGNPGKWAIEGVASDRASGAWFEVI